jgi:hypothetical protein
MEISAAVTTGSWTCDAESFNFLDGDGIVRKWRANNPMGGYTDYIQYESGRLETFNVTTCVWCYGKKICAICFGMGGQMIMGYWYPC